MKLGLIGAGNMASALARGIGEPVLVHDVDEAKAEALAEELGGEAVGSNAELAERSDVLVLCHKPGQLEEVARRDRRAREGRRLDPGGDRAPTGSRTPTRARPIHRFIPNIPAEVRRGVLCYVAGPRADEGPEDEILELFGRTGTVIRARRRAADRARDGADGLRARLHGARGRGVRRRPAPRTASTRMTRCAWWWRRWAAPPTTCASTTTTAPALRTRVATPGRHHREGPDRARAERPGRRDPRRRGRGRGGHKMTTYLAITPRGRGRLRRHARIVYLVLIFIRILTSWFRGCRTTATWRRSSSSSAT